MSGIVRPSICSNGLMTYTDPSPTDDATSDYSEEGEEIEAGEETEEAGEECEEGEISSNETAMTANPENIYDINEQGLAENLLSDVAGTSEVFL